MLSKIGVDAFEGVCSFHKAFAAEFVSLPYFGKEPHILFHEHAE